MVTMDFNVRPGEYTVEFERPQGMKFTEEHLGDPNLDSDADPKTGQVKIDVTSDVF